MSEAEHCYLVALGSNVRHVRYGLPRKVLAAAFGRLDKGGAALIAASGIMTSAPLGPSRRTYANAAALVTSRLPPPGMLLHLQQIEREFGRARRGQRWGARTLDLDIVLWSGGVWCDDTVIIPHPEFRQRDFVLRPAAQIAPQMRDPLSGLSVRQHLFRLHKPKALDPRHAPA